MAISAKSKILASDINTALSKKQDKLSYTPVKSVNGVVADSSGNVDAISAMMPDYSAGITVSKETDYVTQFPCYVLAMFNHSPQQLALVALTVNSTLIIKNSSDNMYYNHGSSIAMLFGVGETIKCNVDFTVYPLKGV